MATTGTPSTPSKLDKLAPNTCLPMPPPMLHTRSGNALYDAPHTPTSVGFTSPFATPQGSPSKKQHPPGATDLPNIFDSAMKLGPGSPTKDGRQQLSPHSLNKGGAQYMGEYNSGAMASPDYMPAPPSPTRSLNKENTPPGVRQNKGANFTPSQSALSRQEPYQPRETSDPATRARYNPQRGLTPEELEKLQLPKVKRLANVTQLCKLRQRTSTEPTNP